MATATADINRLNGPAAWPLHAPWFAPYAERLRELAAIDDAMVRIERLNEWAVRAGVATESGRVLRFTPQAPTDTAYESAIWTTGRVPTRLAPDGAAWHDLFNALVWLRFPRIKARLNRLQAEAITRDGVGHSRGGLRDAATVFDENALLLVSASGRWADALRDRRWGEVLRDERQRFAAEVRVVAFGHALLLKLTAPYKAIAAHAWPAGDDGVSLDDAAAVESWFVRLDARIASGLDAGSLRGEGFVPLPVLGIPGWWPPNEVPGFYDDETVFRTRRRPHPTRGRT